MQVINAGTNDDGTPHDLVYAPGEHVVLTPNTVNGTITVNGKEYDVTARHLAFDTLEEAQAVGAAIDAIANPTEES